MAKNENKTQDLIFEPRRDQVVVCAKRKENKIILLNDNGGDDGIPYEYLEVISFGPLVKDMKVGDRIKLSTSIVAQPEFLYCNYADENDTPPEGKLDFLLVQDAFIKGFWRNKEVKE